ncbi:hypothetical protein [Streptomyces cylindrosporus]|uniref:Uncharacterized protein n=1 Tax=Streptomyces cylindrosporus TaxID=2927583 RepID=A0ABS9Y2I7_9ACTN|nr:hypothetical protein [Streptomyces cylindrosporus]MCI3271410.1 hypothetical protein [Streptomyces cylindrosporus]
MPYMAINLGGVTAGVSVILWFAVRWWFAEHRRWTALVPFVLALLYGMLAALAAFGSASALGLAVWLNLWAANVAGYVGLVWGVGGNAPDVTRASQLALTDGGYVTVLLMTVVLIALCKFAKKIPTGKIVAGAFAGIAIALSGSVAGVAAIPLGSGANFIGAGFAQAFG